MGLFFLLSLVIFLATVGASVGLWWYHGRLLVSRANAEAELAAAKNRFEPATLQAIQVLDSRLTIAGKLLAKHTTLAPILDYLEAHTLSGIRFRTLSYNASPASGTVEVKMSGEASSYEAVALQSDAFATGNLFKQFIFSDLNLDASGNIVFQFSGTVDPAALQYVNATPLP